MSVGDNSNNTAINHRSCPYRGNGIAGLGKLLLGLSQSHGMTTVKDHAITNQDTVDTKRLLEDIVTDYDKDYHHLTGAERECLVNSIAQACKDYKENYWTVQQAKDDVKEITDAMFSDYKEKVVPKILNKQCTHGLYNDTSTQRILDHAYAETQKKATELTLNNINRYFDNYQQLAVTLINFIAQGIADIYHEDFHQLVDRDKKEDDKQAIDIDVNRDIETRNELNLKGLTTDMATILIASNLFEKWLGSDYKECGGVI